MNVNKPAAARNHHWIPQCYLKGFSRSRSKNAKLFIVDAVGRKSFETIPRNVASARDFNRIDIPGLDPNQIESEFSNFESQVDKALERMADTRQFGSAEDHNLILNLIALLSTRNPRMRENSRDFHERVARRMMELTVATEERYDSSFYKAARDGFLDADSKVPYAEMRNFIKRGDYAVTVATTRHVDQELKMAGVILPLLGSRSWLLITAPANSGGFITSDHPVVLQWSDGRNRGAFDSPGFGLRDTEVIFAVTHEIALLGTFDGRHGVQQGTAEVVAHINGMIAAHSERQIYAKDDRFRYARASGEICRGADILRDLPVPERGRKD
jgi:hypothetical protein